jgi:hypothetical protein
MCAHARWVGRRKLQLFANSGGGVKQRSMLELRSTKRIKIFLPRWRKSVGVVTFGHGDDLRRRRVGTPPERVTSETGLPDFLVTIYQQSGNVPNYHNIYQMVIKYIKWL